MEYVRFGATGLQVSRLCLGCMTYGSPAWRPWVLDEAASRFQSMAGLKAPDIYVVTLGGRRGSIQRMFPASDGFPNGFRPADLSKADLDVVQREHVLDWFLSNHDGHRDQFLRLEDGTMVGIDKGQAFRWFGQDRLDFVAEALSLAD